MLQQFLCATILCVTSTMCSAADQNTHNAISEVDQKKLACMPTILRDICTQNMNTSATANLLDYMMPSLSPKEKLQKTGIACIIKNFDHRSDAEYNKAVRHEVYYSVGQLICHCGNIKRDNKNHIYISPETIGRLADETCDYIFSAKQPQEHPYDAQEEENNWMRFAKKMPARFAELSIPFIKQHWNDPYLYIEDTGNVCRSLARIAYLFSHSDKELAPDIEFLFTWIPPLGGRKAYAEIVRKNICSIVSFTNGKKEDYALVNAWTEEFMKVFSKN